MSLMDILKNRKQAPIGGLTPDASALSQQIEKSATGKQAAPTSGPGLSGLGAQTAAAQTAAQSRAIDTQQLLAAQQLGQQQKQQTSQFQLAQKQQSQRTEQAQADLASRSVISEQELAAREDMAIAELGSRESRITKNIVNNYSQALADLASSRGIAEQEIFEWVRQEQETLSAEEQNAWLEQTAHTMAMSDSKYLMEIRQVGALNRLEEGLKFQEQAIKLQFSRDLDIMQKHMDFQSGLLADDREFKRQLNQMSTDAALELADQAIREKMYTDLINTFTGMATQYATSGAMGGGTAAGGSAPGADLPSGTIGPATPTVNI